MSSALHRIFTPHPALAGVLMHLLVKQLPACSYTVPASAQPMLLLLLEGRVRLAHGGYLPRIALCGPAHSARAGTTDVPTRFLSVTFRAGQFPRLFGRPLDEFVDLEVDLYDWLPRPQVDELLDRIDNAADIEQQVAAVQHFLLAKLAAYDGRSSTLHLPYQWADRSVTALGDEYGLGARQFERRFRNSYGMTLRSYRQQIRYGMAILSI
ncbi:hypothetical protein, partial [Chitinimonas sp.]|uniref:hypothetical protein n=1 Tax=Chitinimonas sp. TaxID=1934313 RepID=UPI0035B0F468